jgi:O-methyltransferase involved in polyketide biosynthesis
LFNFVLSLVWQIISCGAGFDTSFFRLAANGCVHPELHFYEVDFAEVVDRKAECILGSQPLQDCIGSFEGKKEGPEDCKDSLSSS